MGEINLTKRDLFAANKRAFVDIFGDPFATPEPIPGHYQTLKGRGPVAAMKNNFDEGKATRNPASPNIIDFFCDVERIIDDTLTDGERVKFRDTYLYEETGRLTQDERTDIEQRLGRVLRAKAVSPVRRYFTVLRRSIPSDHERSNHTNRK